MRSEASMHSKEEDIALHINTARVVVVSVAFLRQDLSC